MRGHGCRDLLICCKLQFDVIKLAAIKRRNSMPISRREMVGGIATLATTPASAKTDRELVALGNQFDALTRVFDTAYDDAQFEKVENAILNTQAVTMEGLRVKARAACWARVGDLDPASGSTTDERMALSIIRDLIRLFDPKLERPGALQNVFPDDFEQV
jgi:hypothetical protein